MTATNNQVVLRSPQEAANTFSHGGFPRQRNVFVVNFVTTTGNTSVSNLTFAAKSVDRPRINPKTEELSQYNKKRQIYTGYKLEPIRMQFYDSKDGAAQNMWTQYGRYYFGDLNNQTNGMGTSSMSYNYDVTTNSWLDPYNTGFGFTANNGGASTLDINAQFFFDRIEIYHFYDGLYDLYYLIHPKIASFEPDDLDYQNSDVCMISLQVAYENLQYFPGNALSTLELEAFQLNQKFFGNTLTLPKNGSQTLGANTSQLSSATASNPSIGSLLANLSTTVLNPVQNYRFTDPSGAALGIFGNFVFGPSAANVNNQSLTTMTLGNPALTTALSIGSTTNPLASSTSVMVNAMTATSRGIDGAKFDVMNAKTMAATSGYGTAGTTVTKALLASNAINGSGLAIDPAGQITLSPTGYGTINSQMTGTAQYGYNVQTDDQGNSWGYTGPQGFVGPVGTQNPGPYTTDEPSGLYGRFDPPQTPIQPIVGGNS